MKNFSNTYIFLFSAVMVILVAALLSVVAQKLKPVQDMNIKVETMQNILKSVHIESTEKNAEKLFNQYITESYVIDSKGEKVKGIVAIDVDLTKEVAKIDKIKKLEGMIKKRKVSPFKAFMSGFIQSKTVDAGSVRKQIQQTEGSRLLPVYVCTNKTDTYYVFPVRGKGLWGPIWGFISLKSDLNTVYGAVFDHKTETPGLGAEIAQNWFQKEFSGKKLYKNGVFNSVKVVKGGTDASNPYGVNAISGATITSRGVEAMLYDCLISYEPFFKKLRK